MKRVVGPTGWLVPCCLGLGIEHVCPNASYTLPLTRRSDSEVLLGEDTWHAWLINVTRGGRGLEIGGPTKFIEGLYTHLEWASLDIVNVPDAVHGPQIGGLKAPNVNSLQDGASFLVDGKELGRLFVRDGSRLGNVGPYDVVMAFHTLEHFADPLRALREWDRVLVPGGAIVLMVPAPIFTYDKNVPPSTMYDLILDFTSDLGVYRPEIAALLERRARAYLGLVDVNARPSGLGDPKTAHLDPGHHWHVFDFALLDELMKCLGYDVRAMTCLDNWHEFVLATKRTLPDA